MTTPSRLHPLKALHILCAEDQSIYSDLIAFRFEDAGHKVRCVSDGQAAWETISDDPTQFDLLITDQQMPPLDGLSLVRRLREIGFPGKIIVHAAGLTSDTAGRFKHLKVDAIVPKGPESDRLLGVAEALFRCARSPALHMTGVLP